MISLFLAAALASATPVTPETAVTICRIWTFIDAKRGKELFDALPEEAKPAVAAICLGYANGAVDTIKALQRPKA